MTAQRQFQLVVTQGRGAPQLHYREFLRLCHGYSTSLFRRLASPAEVNIDKPPGFQPARVCLRSASLRRARVSAWRFTFALAAIILALGASYSSAQEQRPTESQVEAAYLYNFGKFVTWPADRAAPAQLFEICVLGRDPFGQVLDTTVTGESIDGRKIAIMRIPNMQQAASCSILFVSSSEEGRLGVILEAAQRFNLLTVSNIKHFAERGGDIGLVSQNDKIRFEVNRAAAARSHLLLSSELLKVAVKVIGEPGS